MGAEEAMKLRSRALFLLNFSFRSACVYLFSGACNRELQSHAASESKAMNVAPEIDLHSLTVAEALRVLKDVLEKHRRARKAAKKGLYPYKCD